MVDPQVLPQHRRRAGEERGVPQCIGTTWRTSSHGRRWRPCPAPSCSDRQSGGTRWPACRLADELHVAEQSGVPGEVHRWRRVGTNDEAGGTAEIAEIRARLVIDPECAAEVIVRRMPAMVCVPPMPMSRTPCRPCSFQILADLEQADHGRASRPGDRSRVAEIFADSGRSRSRCRPSKAAPLSARWPRRWLARSNWAACCCRSGYRHRQDARLSRPRDPQRPRVLVSTGTKKLQEQIYFKDLAGFARRWTCPSPPRA